MNELNIFKLSLEDYFTKSMIKILLIPLLGSAVVLYILFFSVASSGFDSLENMQVQIEQRETLVQNGQVVQNDSSESYTGSGVIDFLLKYTVTSWILGFLVYSIGIFAIGYLSIFISIIIVGFLSPRILSIVHRRHYNDISLQDGYGTVIDGITKLIKTAFVMIVLFFVLFPFYFIPGINIIAINLPFYYLFHKMLHYDVGSTLLEKESFKQLYYFNKSNMRIKTVLLYSLSLVPFVAFFISTFYIIYLGHSYLSLIRQGSNA